MSVIEKLSDRNGLVFEAIKMVLVNAGNMNIQRLQWELFKCGIYIKQPLLLQAMAVMKEKNTISRIDEKKETSEAPGSEAGTPSLQPAP